MIVGSDGRPHTTRAQITLALGATLITIKTQIRALERANRELTELIAATGSTMLDLHGIGPSGAARMLGDIGDISRFADKGRFAAWNGTAPLEAFSDDQTRRRISRTGNRRVTRVLHVLAIVELRNDTEGRRYFDRKVADGKTKMEAMRCLTRRLSDLDYAHMRADAQQTKTGPGGQRGTTLQSSVANSHPDINTSDQSLPGPPNPSLDGPPRGVLTPRGVMSGRSAASRSGRPHVYPPGGPPESRI